MITVAQYFGKWIDHPDVNLERRLNAEALVSACAKLKAMAAADGVEFPINPTTGSNVSGESLGGFRPQNCSIGAARSSHKEGLAVDLYDPEGEIDEWCVMNLDRLADCGIYIEHPEATEGWSHWTIKPPRSGRRVFYP